MDLAKNIDRLLIDTSGIIILPLILIFISLTTPLQAQSMAYRDTATTTAITIGLHRHYGFIIPHSRDVRQVATSNPRGLEVDLSFHFTSEKAWEYLHGYPRLGASFAYFNFDNPDVLGNGYSLILFTEPFLASPDKFSMSFRLGLGLIYLDTPFHPENNPENLFYSTAFSFPLVANIMANYRFHEYFMLRFGGTYHHISNGGIQQPNKGINYPTLTAGINYFIRPADFPERSPTGSSANGKKLHYLLAISGGAKDSWNDNSRKQPVAGISGFLSQRIGRINGLLAGAEWMADFSIREELKDKEISRDFQRGGILVGHEFLIGRIRFNQSIGYYLYAPHKARDRFYQRYGLEYQTNRQIFLGVNLKAHRHVADYLDFRTGIRF